MSFISKLKLLLFVIFYGCETTPSLNFTVQVEREVIEPRKKVVPIEAPQSLKLEFLESTAFPSIKISNLTKNLIRLSYVDSTIEVNKITYNAVSGNTSVMAKDLAVSDKIIPAESTIIADFWPTSGNANCQDDVKVLLAFKELEKNKITYVSALWSASYFYDKSIPEIRDWGRFKTEGEARAWGMSKYGKKVKIQKLGSKAEAREWKGAIVPAKSKTSICGYKL